MQCSVACKSIMDSILHRGTWFLYVFLRAVYDLHLLYFREIVLYDSP